MALQIAPHIYDPFRGKGRRITGDMSGMKIDQDIFKVFVDLGVPLDHPYHDETECTAEKIKE
eukprot:4605-Eustigmatos_ZCMA.PRE.1